MKLDIDIVKNVLYNLENIKKGEMEAGLCNFADKLLMRAIITDSEFNRFIKIIYKYRPKYVSENRQDTIWFFPAFQVTPRIRYLKQIIGDLEKEQSKKVLKKSGKQKSSRRK